MNRLTHASKTGTNAYFWYDGFNRICTWQSTGGPGVRFNVWDGWNLIEEYNYPDDSLNTTYLYGAGSDELVSMTRSGVTSYFFQDGRGNTSQAVDSNGGLVETTRYDVHGNPATTVAAGKTATGNRFLFTGREYFSTTGLYSYRNRFYLPDWGRFLQPDPIGFAGDEANLYRYCGNNPVNWSDPYGLTVTQFGPSLTLNIPWLTFGIGVGVAIDGNGSVGVYITPFGALGGSAGLRGALSLGVGISNANTIQDIKKVFAIVGGGLDAELGASDEAFAGRDSKGRRVFGGMVSADAGAGAAIYTGRSYTFVIPIYQAVPVDEGGTLTNAGLTPGPDGKLIPTFPVDNKMGPAAPTGGGGNTPRGGGTSRPANFGAAGLPIPTGGSSDQVD